MDTEADDVADRVEDLGRAVAEVVARHHSEAPGARADCGDVVRRLERMTAGEAIDFLVDRVGPDALREELETRVGRMLRALHLLRLLQERVAGAPEAARPALELLAGQLRDLRARIETVTKRIEVAQKTDPLARRLATIPGLGPIPAMGLNGAATGLPSVRATSC